MFVALWEFEVKPGCEDRFESIYSPSGAWTRLFQRDPSFHETLLLRDPFRRGYYVAIDFWESQDSYERFKGQNSAEYRSLDHACEDFTLAERHIGSFQQIID